MRTLRSLLLLFLAFGSPCIVFAQSDPNPTIQYLENKISEAQRQGSSLTKQISLIESQITLTTLRITDTRKKIDLLDTEIEKLSNEIEKLEDLKTRRLQLVLYRIPSSYKRVAVPQFGWLLLSRDFSDLVSRAKYLVHIQNEDTNLYKQLELAQQNYNEHRDTREEKKTEQEKLRAQLEQHTKDLAGQKQQKSVFLAETRNSEAEYQRLLAQALAEKKALELALIDKVKIGPVKRGDPIALVGNTGYPGCSTGSHLHFEVRRGGSWVDPSQFVSGKTVIDEQRGGNSTLGTGSWDWPLSDTIRLTQHYGKTPWSWRYAYSGGVHTGFDMVSTGGSVIRAPADGELFSSSQNCGSSSVIKIKYIDHGDNVLSFYLHVQ